MGYFKSRLLLTAFLCSLTIGIQAKITLTDEEMSQLDKHAILQILQTNNYNPNVISNAGDTAVHLAVKKNDLAAFKLVLLYGLNPLIPNKALDTPLHVAAEKGNSVFVKLLLEKGAQMSSTNMLGLTPYHKALKNNHGEIMDLFFSLGYVPGDKTTDYLIALGYNPKTVDKAGNTVLHKAAVAGDMNVVQMLIESGWQVDSLNKMNKTPLMLAISKGHLEMVSFLISHKANIALLDTSGYSSLIIAVRDQQIFIIEILLNEMKNLSYYKTHPTYFIDGCFANGINAFHYACAGGNTYIVELLLQYGASINLLTQPTEWSNEHLLTRDDWEAMGEFGGSVTSGYLAPKATSLAIAERLCPENSTILQLLKDKGAISTFIETPKIDYYSKHHGARLSLEDYFK